MVKKQSVPDDEDFTTISLKVKARNALEKKKVIKRETWTDVVMRLIDSSTE